MTLMEVRRRSHSVRTKCIHVKGYGKAMTYDDYLKSGGLGKELHITACEAAEKQIREFVLGLESEIARICREEAAKGNFSVELTLCKMPGYDSSNRNFREGHNTIFNMLDAWAIQNSLRFKQQELSRDQSHDMCFEW